MKKIILSFLLAMFMLSYSPVMALTMKEVKAPVWEEYVPKKYIEPRSFPNRGKNIAELAVGIVLTDLLITAPIGIPMICHSTTKMKNQGYYEKKIKFDNGLKKAETITNPEEKQAYYETLIKQCKFKESIHKKRLKQIAKEENKVQN